MQSWLRSLVLGRYMDIIKSLIRDTRKTTKNCISALYALYPMFFEYNHTNYAQYVPVYLITQLNLSDTHPRCKELLENNKFSVSQSSVLKSVGFHNQIKCNKLTLWLARSRILPDASNIIVTSKVTRHRCISTTCMILNGYILDSFVQHWCGQQKVPSEYQQHRSEYGKTRNLHSHRLFHRL